MVGVQSGTCALKPYFLAGHWNWAAGIDIERVDTQKRIREVNVSASGELFRLRTGYRLHICVHTATKQKDFGLNT